MDSAIPNEFQPQKRKIPVISFLLRHWGKLLIAAIIIVPSIALVRFLTTEVPPEYLTEDARRGDLIQTVEAIGTIISEKDLELKFPVSGVVAEVLVDEGDFVTGGQELARLKAGSLQASVTSAQAKLTTALAELAALEEGTRPEDIAVAEAELENKRASLDLARTTLASSEESLAKANAKLAVLRKESETNLTGYRTTAGSTIIKELSAAGTALGVIDDVLSDVVVVSMVRNTQTYAYAVLLKTREQAEESVGQSRLLNTEFATNDDAIYALQKTSTSVRLASSAITLAYDFIVSLPVTGNNFTVSKKEDLKSTLAAEKTNTATALDNINDALKTFQSAVADYETQIATEESTVATAQGTRNKAIADIQTYEAAVRKAEAELALKRAGTRQSDIDASHGKVQQARADLQKAQADLSDTVLRAPIDGTITKVNLKEGEFTPGQFSETGPAITILGSSPYRLEMFVAEIDIPKVRLHQKGRVDLDAFPRQPFDLTVSEIDPAATMVDGVPKYRITLDFAEPDESFKIGMTGDADIITGEKDDVLMVPARAVIEQDDGSIVRILQGEDVIERPVTTGMENDTDIEIRSGVEEGETVIVLIKE